MGHLRERMDAGIRPAGAVHHDFLLRDLAECRMQRALDSRQAGLELPAMEISPLIGDGKFEIAHSAVLKRIIARRGGVRLTV